MNLILAQYKVLVDFLGKALGPDYEVVLHDLTNGSNEIIAIANGDNSKREVGSPLTSKALSFIESGVYRTSDYKIHYSGITPSNERTVSSTMFIKDEGQLIGMLCVNYNAARFMRAMDQIIGLGEAASIPMHHILGLSPSREQPAAEPAEPPELFPTNVGELISSVLAESLEPGTSADRLHQEEKIEIIKKLKDLGVFSLKGAVHETAVQLCCSEPTIYRYLKNL